jgi:tRNA(Arg) A34 adenosine deaminase TadA
MIWRYKILMKIIQKTIRKAYNSWNPNRLVRCYHYCAAFDGGRMICFAQNNPIKTHAAAYRIGEDFNLPKYKEFPFFHSESRLIDKLLNKYNTIDSSWKIVVMRINRCGLILGSKPCENCSKLLSAVGLNEVYYSNDDGSFCDNFGFKINVDELTMPTTLV